MPASIPNMNSIHTMGQQFKTNVFEKVSHASYRGAATLGAKAKAQSAPGPGTPTAYPKTSSPASPTDAPLGAGAVAAGRARRQAKAGYTPVAATHAAPDFSAANVAKGHALERGATSTHAAPSFASPSTLQPQQMPSHRSSAPTNMTPSSAQGTGKHRAGPVPNPVAPQPAPRIGHIIPGAGKVDIPSMQRSAPSNVIPYANKDHTQAQQFSNIKGSGVTPDRVDVSTKDNSPFPTHVHPENSSNLNMHDLSRKISAPGKPNPVTLGSRNIKGGGIASMGSQLEESLRTKPLTLPPKRKRV